MKLVCACSDVCFCILQNVCPACHRQSPLEVSAAKKIKHIVTQAFMLFYMVYVYMLLSLYPI